jgi:quercetin dioxygenase-like cupin family protein
MNLEYTIKPKTTSLNDLTESIKLLSYKVGLDYNELVKSTYNGRNVYDIPVTKGKAQTTGLFKNTEVAVAETEFAADTVFVNHIHEEFELIKIVVGELHITMGEEVKVIKEHEAVLIPPYVVHDSFAPVNTVAIVITVPACPSWPEG